MKRIKIWWNKFYKKIVLTTADIRDLAHTLEIPIENIDINAVAKEFLTQVSENIAILKNELLGIMIKKNIKKPILNSKRLKI